MQGLEFTFRMTLFNNAFQIQLKKPRKLNPD